MLSIAVGPLPASWQAPPPVSRCVSIQPHVLGTIFYMSPPETVRLAAAALSATLLCKVSRRSRGAVSRQSRGGSRGGEEHSVRLSPQTEAEQEMVKGVMQELLNAADLVTSAAGDSASSTANGTSTQGKAASAHASEEDRWVINLLYDGDCHVCMKQVEFLTKRMDENPEYAGLVRLTNLADPAYDPTESGGVAFEDGMRHIHAVTRDGEVVMGMDVFRRVYAAIGMEWVYALTKLPFMGAAFDRLYDVWAEHRLLLTGREDVIQKVRQHQQKIEELSNQDECEVTCEIDWDNM